MQIEQLQKEIEKLSAEDFSRLRRWFADKDWERWDQELEQDVVAGRLDILLDGLDFGEAHHCTSTAEVVKLFSNTHGDEHRSALAAYGMALAVGNAINGGKYRDDALIALNQLARAKAEIDIAALHLMPEVDVTSQILLSAQHFADKATIPCTEWPSQEAIAEVVCREARKYALGEQKPGPQL